MSAAAAAPRAQLFQVQVAANASYWRERVEQQAGDLAALDPENENLARAVWLALGAAQTRPGAYALIVAAREFILRRGGAEAWSDLLGMASRLARSGPRAPEAASVLAVTAELHERRARPCEADACYSAAIDMCRGLAGADEVLAGLQVDFGWLLVSRGAGDDGRPYLEEALALSREHGYRLVAMRALLGLGMHYNLSLEGAAARPYLERALVLARDLGEATYLGRAHYELGIAYWGLGDLRQAEFHADEAASSLRTSGHIVLLAQVRNLQGMLCFERDDFAGAVEHFTSAEEDFVRLGDARELAALHNNLGAAYWGLQRWDAAVHCFQLALSEHRARRSGLRVFETLLNLAECYLEQGQWERAAEALGEARAPECAEPGSPPAGWQRARDRLAALELRLERRGQPPDGATPGAYAPA